MHAVNDFKLVSLSALVHDEAQFKAYRAFINRVGEVYDADTAKIMRNDFNDAVILEHRVMEKEVAFWRDYGALVQPADFLKWADSKHGFGSRYESDTSETYYYSADMLVNNNTGALVGRSTLFAGIDGGIWTGMGYDCIHPDHRGQGLGRIILAHRLDQARHMGIDKMKLNVRESNLSSLRRLEKLDAAGLLSNHRHVHGHIIAWIEPKLTLAQAYGILSGRPKDQPAPLYPDIAGP